MWKSELYWQNTSQARKRFWNLKTKIYKKTTYRKETLKINKMLVTPPKIWFGLGLSLNTGRGQQTTKNMINDFFRDLTYVKCYGRCGVSLTTNYNTSIILTGHLFEHLSTLDPIAWFFGTFDVFEIWLIQMESDTFMAENAFALVWLYELS